MRAARARALESRRSLRLYIVGFDVQFEFSRDALQALGAASRPGWNGALKTTSSVTGGRKARIANVSDRTV
jgi:hypothetical protein